MNRRPDCSLILPCFNESGLFAGSMARIQNVLKASRYSYEVIFVDDKSRDDTADLIRRYCERHADCSAVYHSVNAGRGKAVSDGIRKAKGTVVGFIDIDCEVSPVYIPHMVSVILTRQSDVVIGKRYYRTSIGSVVREILSKGYTWLSDAMVGTGGMDTESGYKFFRRTMILPVLARARAPGWFWDTEIILYAKRAGLAIREEPVLFMRRFDKRSSVRIFRDTADYLVHLWVLRKKLSRRRSA